MKKKVLIIGGIIAVAGLGYWLLTKDKPKSDVPKVVIKKYTYGGTGVMLANFATIKIDGNSYRVSGLQPLKYDDWRIAINRDTMSITVSKKGKIYETIPLPDASDTRLPTL